MIILVGIILLSILVASIGTILFYFLDKIDSPMDLAEYGKMYCPTNANEKSKAFAEG